MGHGEVAVGDPWEWGRRHPVRGATSRHGHSLQQACGWQHEQSKQLGAHEFLERERFGREGLLEPEIPA